MTFLQVQHLGKRFDSQWALKDVSFAVEEGRFITLLGPSGCGKTTLLNIIAGFLPATEGTLTVRGEDIGKLPPDRRDSAMCFQSYALFPHLNVRENIGFGPRQRRLKQAEVTTRVNQLIEQVSLEAHAEKLPGMLSGGQQQRVALARALAVRPSLMLFDEPLSNLDAKLRIQVRLEIRALQKQHGFTAIYVTHDQAEALAMSDEILLLNKGQLEQAGTPQDIYFRPRTAFVADFIGGANIHHGRLTAQGQMPTGFGPIATASKGPTENTAICWRPEAAMLSGSGELAGVIRAAEFLGAHWDLHLAAGDETVRLTVPGTEQVELGATVRFDVPAAAVVVLDDAR